MASNGDDGLRFINVVQAVISKRVFFTTGASSLMMPARECAVAIRVVDIIVERREHILLTKKGDFWIFPGGELEEGEEELHCLERVVAKEMQDQIASIFKKLPNTVVGQSPVRGGEVEVTIYVGDISKEKMSDLKDCNACWFNMQSLSALRLSNISKMVLEEYMNSRL